MNKFFWAIVIAETIALASLFYSLLNSPSESGGREMGMVFSVMLPFAVVVCASLVYWKAGSTVTKSIAFAVAAAPALIVAFAWARNLALEKELANDSVNAFHDPGQRALARAVLGGNAGRVAGLAGRTKLNEPGLQQFTGSDSTLLTLALAEKKPATLEIVRTLLKAGADPNQTSQKGWTIPLVRAIMLQEPSLVAALLDAGADPNRQDPQGGVAYHVAINYSDDVSLSILKQMLDKGAKPDAANGSRQTALMLAAIHGNGKAMDLLLNRGANRQMQDDKGKTALDYAENRIREMQTSVDPGFTAAFARLRAGN